MPDIKEEELSPEQLEICSRIVRGVIDLVESKPDFSGANIPVLYNGKEYTIYIGDNSKQYIQIFKVVGDAKKQG